MAQMEQRAVCLFLLRPDQCNVRKGAELLLFFLIAIITLILVIILITSTIMKTLLLLLQSLQNASKTRGGRQLPGPVLVFSVADAGSRFLLTEKYYGIC